MKGWLIRHWLLILIISLAAFGLIWIGYLPFTSPYSGFGESTKVIIPPNPGIPSIEYQPAKTIWNWLELFIVPLVIAIGVAFINSSLKRTELQVAEQRSKMDQAIAEDRKREELLQNYLDKMTELLLSKDSGKSDYLSPFGVLARARTLTVLNQLDSKRKGILISFLYEAQLIQWDYGKPKSFKVGLNGANLSDTELSMADLMYANFRGANLSRVKMKGIFLGFVNFKDTIIDGAEIDPKWLLVWKLINHGGENEILRGIDLSQSCLQEVNLKGADLSHSKLNESYLNQANLNKSNLEGADLHYVILQGAHLENANLQDADLSNADLGDAHLENADLRGANLSYTNLGFVDLSGADLSGAVLHLTRLKATKVSENTKLAAKWRLTCEILNSGGQNRDLQGVDLSWANLEKANLQGANLNGANLHGAHLSGANLGNANLKDVDLGEDYIDNTNFSKALISRDQLMIAGWMQDMILPDGTTFHIQSQ